MARVKLLGHVGWIDDQFATAPSALRYDWLIAGGYAKAEHKNVETVFDPAVRRQAASAQETLRQRVTLALSEITVTAIDGLR